MSGKIGLEVCVDSVAGAMAAQACGADRVELCTGLLEGGTTPSAAMIELTRRHAQIELNVMVRPRGGDFLYRDDEFEVMKRDIEHSKRIGADGVVFGILTEEGRVDAARTAELVGLAHPLSVTFHRAFDMTRDPFEALEDLAALKIKRVLSSGQAPTALLGIKTLAALTKSAKDRISVMPGGGVTEENIRTILIESGAAEIHVHPKVLRDSPMRYRNPNVSMGAGGNSEYQRFETDGERIKAFVKVIRSLE